MSNVRRVYSEKMPAFAVKAKELSDEISNYLNINTVKNVRVLIRYDIENISDEVYKDALVTVRRILERRQARRCSLLNFSRDSSTREPILPYSV